MPSYSGDINGRFWAGQTTEDVELLHLDGAGAVQYDLHWDCCGELSEDPDTECPNSKDDEDRKVKHESETSCFYEFKWSQLQMDKITQELQKMVKTLKLEEDTEEQMLTRFRALADQAVHPLLLKEVKRVGKQHKELPQGILARFHLALQIDASLRNENGCIMMIEF
jgi:hypothetical protein